eukprot:UN13132
MAISPELMDNSTISMFNLNSNNLSTLKIQNKTPYVTKGGRDLITNIQLPESIEVALESQPYVNPFKWNILIRIGGYKDGQLTDECNGIVFNSDEPDLGYHINLPPFAYKDNPQIIYNQHQYKIYCFAGSKDITKIVTLDTNAMQYDFMRTQLSVPHALSSLCFCQDSKLYVLGGKCGKFCEILDIDKHECVQIANLNKSRCEAASLCMQSKPDTVLIGGGYGDWDKDGFKTEKNIEMYNA